MKMLFDAQAYVRIYAEYKVGPGEAEISRRLQAADEVIKHFKAEIFSIVAEERLRPTMSSKKRRQLLRSKAKGAQRPQPGPASPAAPTPALILGGNPEGWVVPSGAEVIELD
jgi:hypothetical protein